MEAARATSILLHRRFEARAAERGDQPAVVGSSQTLSYRALDRKANALAHALAELGGDPETPVALFLDHDAPLIAAILGSLKAGRPYTYLDPSYPRPRLARILADATPAALVTSRSLQARLVDHVLPGAPLIIEQQTEILEPPAVHGSPNAACALVYTSGSTGEPRAVLRSHRSVHHNIENYSNALNIGAADRLSLVSSASFGAAQTAIFAALLNGACLLPFDVRGAGFAALGDWLRTRRISIFHAVPTLFRHLALSLESPLPALRFVKLGGEAVFRSDLELFHSRFGPDCRLLNGLGMTEACGNICYFFADQQTSTAGATLPIGSPVRGRKIELLDASGDPVAAGAVGEIVVTSRYLASGYWRRPELTRQVFQRVPDDPEARRLRTGDLGCLAADGWLYHKGRKDRRIMLRGFRIELGEIEGTLLEHPNVRHAVAEIVAPHASPRMHASPRLTIYLVGDGSPLRREALRSFLRTRLPEHLIPNHWVLVDELPLTANGKLDHAALRARAWAPESESELEVSDTVCLQLQMIFEELLELESVALDADFFALGGDSLLAARLLAQIEHAFGIKLAPSALFAESSVASLVAAIQHAARALPAPSVVVFAARADATPLVFLHGDFNDGGFYCRGLSQALGARQPLIALPPLVRPGELLTIEQRARQQLTVLRSAVPRGPYYLAGFCTGGLVAFEMARQLAAAGEQVPMLAVLDASPAAPELRAVWAGVECASVLLGLSHAQRLRLLRDARAELNKLAPLRTNDPSRNPLRRLVGTLRKAATMSKRQLRLAFAAARNSTEPPPDRGAAFLWARACYRLRPYPGRLTFILAAERSPQRTQTLKLWRAWVAGIDSHELPGGHHDAITRHIDLFADVLRRAIETSQQGSPAR